MPNKVHGPETSAIIGLVSVASLIEALPDALLVVDQLGGILLCNPQAEWLFGRPRLELMAMPIEDLLPNRFQAAHVDHRAGYATAPEVRAMNRGKPAAIKHRTGAEILVNINLSPVMTPAGMLILATIRRHVPAPSSPNPTPAKTR